MLEFWVELAVLVPAGTPYRWLAAPLLTAVAIAVAFGRRAPLVAVVVTFGTLALLPALTHVYYDELALPFAMPFVTAYWLGRYAGQRALFAGIAIALPLGLMSTVPYARETTFASGVFVLAVTIGAPVLVARLLRGRAELHGALREKAALLERRREDAAGRAVVDERTRIAGELHDVVAHALSAMTVQATGARRLALTRPELARAAFEAIETSGREALDELRRLLGVLRREDAELTLAPQPSLRHVASLARQTTAAGLPVLLRVEGEPRELAAGLDVTAYRVAQEGLAAARDVGGAGRAEVRLRYGADALDVEVRDDGALLTPRPLTGIRERVLLHGGRLVAGRRRSGGHTVRATLPLDGRTMAVDEAADAPCELTVVRDRVLRRVRRHHGLVDTSIAALLAAAGAVEVIVAPDRTGSVLANVLVAFGYTVPLAWRRRAPLAVAAAVVAATLLMGLTLTPVDSLFVPLATILSSAYGCGAYRDGRVALAGLVLVAAALPVITATMEGRIVADYVFPPLLMAVAWLAGRAVRTRTRLAAELHEAAARVAEASEEEQKLAASEERRRIAREMHDLVAHSMSVMVVQAGGARRILERDPGRALEAATRIERTGRDALSEMRHLLGVLNGPHAVLAPQPTLGEIGELVLRARSAGLPAVLEFRGERRDLPAGLDLAAYRIVQEGLTNALKHAAHAPTTVTVDWSEATLTLEIRDHGPRAARRGDGGHGLVGMRERVRLYGGEIEAGPAEGGGWRVRATLPVAGDARLEARVAASTRPEGSHSRGEAVSA